MQQSVLKKLMTIGVISLLLLIPLTLIESQITSRSLRQNEVLRSISQSAAGPQTLTGPVIAIRYQKEEDVNEGNGHSHRGLVDKFLVVPPKQLKIDGQAQVETRQRGIFHGQLFHAALNLSGSFAIPSPPSDGLSPRAYLVLAVSDLRGVDNDPTVTIDGAAYHLTTGDVLKPLESHIAGETMYVDLGPAASMTNRSLNVSLPLSLTGTQRLAIAPVGESNSIKLKSDWPHPSFNGRFLPRRHHIDGNGFEADWEISHLSRNLTRSLLAGRDAAQGEALQIDLKEPVNVYLLAERAVKYGILFVLLTFGAFFITESLSRTAIHPVQYLLVGLALAIFFLLLIALSEHISFALSYLVAAVACIGLISTYLSSALGGWLKGAAFGAGLTGLYGVLYGILHSEDNSLLMGSVLLFLALAATMLGTRKINWYSLSRADQQEQA